MSQSLNPGQRPPIAVITPDDQGGAIFVTSGLALAICAVSLVVRLYVRAGFMNSSLGADDIAIGIAFLFLIAQSASLLKAANTGLGKRSDIINRSNLTTLEETLFATDILYIIAVWLTRFSSALFFLRLSQSTVHKWIATTLLVAGALFMLGGVLSISMRCDFRQPWLFIDQHCIGLYTRWVVITIFDILYEIALLCLPIYIIIGLQMKARRKVRVLAAFASRLVIVPPLLLRLFTLPHFYAWTDGKFVSSYDASVPYIYTQIILCVAIVTATLPSLRPFMMATATAFGIVTGSGTGSYGDPVSGIRSKNSKLHNSKHTPPISLNSLKGNGETSNSGTVSKATRWHHRSMERHGYSARVISAENDRDGSIASDAPDDRPIIRRDIQYTVSYGDADLDGSAR